ncbi:hypothetical protein PHMEG_00028781 [Phytophthora megakarya]|uniref:Uncharacterized protein n=1 Tax=Phytophthora megakarya TaxID=4795 RepID=A0A225V2F6_9STRA|nr:hypothetical protein PHMEG_00028781 [Phytophthora megakarya]
MANGVADRLANRALDRKRSAFECASHGTRLVPCPAPTLSLCSQDQQHDDDDHAEERPPRQARTLPAPPVDDAETFPSIRTTPESVPTDRDCVSAS